jgi:NADH:ubiquinone oxidoreductase subunit 3 (subunit A)
MSIQLQNLSNEYNMLISQYQDTYQKYIDVINSDNKTFKTVDNSAFYGQNQINILSNTNVENCQSACSSNSSCSGATFNTLSNNCTLSSGTGNVIQEQKSKAIVKEAMYYSYQLQNLNTKLLDINKQMINTSNNNYDKFQKSQQQTIEQENTMNNNYQILSDERTQIEKMIREYETLNRAIENGNIIVTSNYYSYIALFLIAILLILLFLKFSFTGSQSGGGNNIGYLHNVYKLLPIFLAVFAIFYFVKKNQLANEYY